MFWILKSRTIATDHSKSEQKCLRTEQAMMIIAWSKVNFFKIWAKLFENRKIWLSFCQNHLKSGRVRIVDPNCTTHSIYVPVCMLVILPRLSRTYHQHYITYKQQYYFDFRGTLGEQNRLTRLNLSGTYCHKTSTRHPSCIKPRQPTIHYITDSHMKSYIRILTVSGIVMSHFVQLNTNLRASLVRSVMSFWQTSKARSKKVATISGVPTL